MVLHLILGDDPLFHVPSYRLVNPLEFGIYAILGVAGGIGSVAFVKLLLNLRVWFRQLPKATVWVQPVAGGLAVGLMGWFMPQVLGVGYDYVDRVLGGDFPIRTVAILAVLKIVATPLCYSSGNAGGIFGPSLFIGAMIGGSVGGVAHALLPGVTASPGAYALVGMGAAFAGIVRTPLTSVIMIFEMTRDYSIIVPLMISNLISFIISRQLQPEPIYEALARQEGVHLPTAESRDELTGDRVAEIMRVKAPLIPLEASPEEARRFLEREKANSWPVGEANRIYGVIGRRVLEGADPAARWVRDLVNHGLFSYVHADHPLSYALQRMRDTGVDVLPVVSRADLGEMSGIVTLNQILEAYGVADQQSWAR
jgi:CIC family chloride channel protein